MPTQKQASRSDAYFTAHSNYSIITLLI
jgi:hypothetical protein